MGLVDFNNTKNAFAYRSMSELIRAKLLFSTLKHPALVNLSSNTILGLNHFRLSPNWILKPFMFKQFCGGTSLDESQKVVNILGNHHVFSIPDYSVEGKTTNAGIDSVVEEIIRTMAFSATNPNFAFSVFKPTALAPSDVLEKMNNKSELTVEEKDISNLFHRRFERLCQMAKHYNVKLLVDAEEFCFQDIIDHKTEEMMEKYNKDKAIIFNTLQMYRHDREAYLSKLIERAKQNNFKIGLKVVRGAYLEKENLRAIQHKYISPIHTSKRETDNSYDRAIAEIIKHIDTCELFVGTHNRESIEKTMLLMKEQNLTNNDSRIFFAQLFGMSDNLTFNLAAANYNAAKYLPYGPVRETIPYLIRRAKENTSVAGQTNRELELIQQEILRRKKEK